MTSFENKIITEKYIIKLKELSCSVSNNYINNRFSLIIKYMNGEAILDNIPLCSNYFSMISTDYKKVPFLIKSDLYSELAFLDSLNQGKLLKVIKEIKANYDSDILNETEIRKTMDDGQIIERNLNLLEEFKTEFGYDPINNSILTKTDDFNLNTNDDDDFYQINKHNEDTDLNSSDLINNPDNQDNLGTSKKTTTKKISNPITTTITSVSTPNYSLDSLNQLFDIMKVDFNEIIKDVVDTESSTSGIKKNKSTTKKGKSTKLVEPVEEIKDYKKHIQYLVFSISKIDLSGINQELAIKAVLELASIYKLGKILYQSDLKMNLLYIFLIKKYNNSEAMYLVGEELIEGSTIQKNVKYGAQLIRAAAEDKHPKAMLRLKNLIRNKQIARNERDNDIVSSSSDEDN